MRRGLGEVLLGLVLGWMLSRLRLATGSDVLAGPVVSAAAAFALRAAALVFVGFALRERPRGAGVKLLIGLALGALVHGLLLGQPSGAPYWDVLPAAALAGFASWLAHAESDAEPVRANVGEMLGLAMLGSGLALALESLARHVRLLGAGLAQDESATLVTLLVLVAVGAVCFGWIPALRICERITAPFFLAASSAACLFGLSIVGKLNTKSDFEAYLRSFGGTGFLAKIGLGSVIPHFDATWHGTLAADVILASAIFVGPAFLLGAGLVGLRGRRAIPALAVGGAAGLLVLRWILARGATASTGEAQIASAQLVPIGLVVAAAGGALAVLSTSSSSGRARRIGSACCLACVLPVLMSTTKPIFVLSPWDRRPVMPYLAFETPEGFMTVEPGEGGLKIATLDRRELTPSIGRALADHRILSASFACLPREKRSNGGVRVLFVGQLSALRVNNLRDLGASEVDRTGGWHASMSRLEAELLKDMPTIAGEVLSPADAHARMTDAHYDLVIVAPAGGDSPQFSELANVPESTVVVRWTWLDEPLSNGAWNQGAVIVSGFGLEQIAVGIVVHEHADRDGELDVRHAPPQFAHYRGPSGLPSPLARLMLRNLWRADDARSSFARDWERDEPTDLTTGVQSACAAQVPSSPYESEAERVELPEESLAALERAALAMKPTAFVVTTWEWIAGILVGKRDVTAIYRYLTPLAARMKPWPVLETALAYADIESLEPAGAVQRLRPLAQSADASFDLIAMYADAQEQSGDAPGGLASWRHAVALRGQDRNARRRYAMALVRAGDPEGATQIGALLREDPNDAELQPFLGPGPWPAPIRGPTLNAHR